MQYDLEQVRTHLALLSGEENSLETFQHYFDPDDLPKRKGLATHFTNRLNESLDYLLEMQKHLCGIYVTVNKTDGKGRKEKNVIGYRNFFVDYDDSTEPSWTIPPTCTTKRGPRNGHGFFHVKGECSKEDWIRVQKHLIMFYKTDPVMTDPPRVIRVAGFLHLKDSKNPQMYRLDIINKDVSYTVDEMIASMPLNEAQQEALDDWVNQESRVDTGTGYEANAAHSVRLLNWAKIQAPVAVRGTGSKTVLGVAGWAHDLGIPFDETQQVLWEHYNPRCEPPWSDEPHEKTDFFETVKRAYTGAHSAAGCRTFKHAVQQRKLPPRTDGWTAQPEILSSDSPDIDTSERDYGRMSKDEAVNAKKMLDAKTPEMEVAIMFDGYEYNGREIYREDKMYYRYNGKTYEYVSDDIIKAEIQKFWYKDKPSSGKINGVIESHKNLVTRSGLANGTWLNRKDSDGSNYSVFNNGIVDLSLEKPIVIPHSWAYFSFASKSYDYDPEAKCPVFTRTINDMFEHDPDNTVLLLEFIGLLLTHVLKWQKFLFLKGVPRGGKGVITNLIRKLVGEENCANPSLQDIVKAPILHSLSTKSVAFCDDVRSLPMGIRDTVLSKLLQLTGCDAQTFDVKFKGAQTCVIPARYVMSSNEIPDFIDASGALLARMLLITFEKSYRGRENLTLGDDLAAELSGICNLATAAYRAADKRGRFTEPESSKIEKEIMRTEFFPLSSFVTDNCDLEDDSLVSVTDLYKSYLVYASTNSVRMPYTKTKLCKQLRSSDLALRMVRKTIDGKKENYLIGIELNQEARDIISLDNVTNFPNRRENNG